MIYTSYFANLRNLPDTITPIAICGKSPDFYCGLTYKKLAPKYSFFKVWKRTHDNDYYIENFNKLVLDELNADEVVKELSELSPTEDFALICYEKPNDFCHRHLVADWLNENGYKCKEFKSAEEQDSAGKNITLDSTSWSGWAIPHDEGREFIVDSIGRKEAFLALIEKGQNSKRYHWGDTWELNASEIREALESLPSVQTKIIADILKLQTYKLFNNDDELYVSRSDVLKLIKGD